MSEVKPESRPDDASSSRRDFLARLLRTVAYTAPIVTAMSMRNLSAAQVSTPVGPMGGGMAGGMGMP